MAAVYSTRVIATALTGQWTYYTVPAGRRLVVRHVTATSGGIGGEFLQCAIGAINVVIYQFLATPRHVFFDVRWTLYPGEQFGWYGGGGAVSGSVNGFLFDDTTRAGPSENETVAIEDPPSSPVAPFPPGYGA